LRNITVEVVVIPQKDGSVIGLTQVLDGETELMLEDKRYKDRLSFEDKFESRFIKNDRFELVKQVDNDTKTGVIYYMQDRGRV
jgi:hypothetical protein